MCHMTCLRLFLLLALSCFVCFVGCDTPRQLISGTDLPHIPSVTLTSSEVTKSRDRIPTEGTFVFAGGVYDALERLRWISRAYVDAGWVPEPPEGSPGQASQIFSKSSSKLELKRSVKITATASRETGSVVVKLYSESIDSSSN